MASSPSPSEYPTAANAVAVPVRHFFLCSGSTEFNDHPIFKGLYNCICELNSDLKVLRRDYKFPHYNFSYCIRIMRMADENYRQLSNERIVMLIRKDVEEMKALAKISRKLDSMEMSPDFSAGDLWRFDTASGEFSLEQTDFRLSHGLIFPRIYFKVVFAQTPDDPEHNESLLLDIPAVMFNNIFKAPELVIAPRIDSLSEAFAFFDYDPKPDAFEFLEMMTQTQMLRHLKSEEDHCHIDIESLEPVDEFEVMRERKKKKILEFLLCAARVPDSLTKGNEIVLGITGQAAFSIMGYALTGSSSSSPALYFVVGATAIGFICTWIALTLKRTKKRAARILGKVGGMATASAVIVAMGTVLPGKTVWISGIACLLTGLAMALA